jgi:hypothetical protein
VALLTFAAARIAAPSGASHYRFSAAMVCGVERWNIKTLKDKPRLRRAALTTVAHLVSLPRPSSLPPSSRLAFERRIFTVTASVTLDRTEADLDHHLVLTSGRNTMIAETPSPVCTQGATAYRRRQMSNSRKCRKDLLASSRDWRGLLRLFARADRSGAERDRASSGARLLLPFRLGPAARR